MSTTRPYPPGDLGPEPGSAGVPSVSPGAAAAASPVVPAGQIRRLRLAGAKGAVARGRDFAREALHDWGWLPAEAPDARAAAEDVLLVASELVTNACLHADGPEELRLRYTAKVLRLEVSDNGSGSPAPRTPHQAGRPGGHGMFIVQRLCSDWGVVHHPDGTGKTVWAELTLPEAR
ncbi:ATP-binding protein [Streptomyces sp. NPDC059740]|uniref:ATP-binding protein n=1 Tax=Streptomyces sp. NPDC059740 TaxID=3346926 RepID=UPI00365E3073